MPECQPGSEDKRLIIGEGATLSRLGDCIVLLFLGKVPSDVDSTITIMVSSHASPLDIIQLNAAGIDIGADDHWVCVPSERDKQSVRRFGCFTPDLCALADWLKQCGIETVAMESTGVYWIPVFQILESRGFEVKLVNAHHLKTVPGRKTDVCDAQWIQQLHSYGLLAGSFRPNDEICVLRSYMRHRDSLVKTAGTHVLRMQKALTQMNVQLHRVISDITGTTGMAIMCAILEGERDPVTLAALKDPRIKASKSQIADALTGDYRAELLFVLKQEFDLYCTHQDLIRRCDEEIEAHLKTFETAIDPQISPPPKPKRKGQKKPGNALSFNVHLQLYRISAIDFTQIPGLGELSILTLFSEVGLDPSRFPSAKHFCSWLGLSPGNRITGGKRKSSKTRPVVNRAAETFRMAAQTLIRSQSALGAFYRRMRSRLGAPKAITAAAHKLARIFYHLWVHGEQYVEPGIDAYEQQYRERTLKQLQRKAEALGCKIIPQVAIAEGVS